MKERLLESNLVTKLSTSATIVGDYVEIVISSETNYPNEIIKKCSNLSALEPLLHVASKEILKSVLTQFVTYLKGNQQELANFARNGGLQKILVLRAKMKEVLLSHCVIHLS